MIPNTGGVDGNWDFRDPKVFRDEQRGQWVMVVSGGDHIRFFTSRNLLDWTHTGFSLLWRATADGKDAYCLNIDPDLRVVRLAVRTNGAFDDAKLLARVPALVRRGSTYPVRVLAQGTRIQVFLAGRRIIDTTDTTYARGCVGLNVFGGRAAFQDAYATEL